MVGIYLSEGSSIHFSLLHIRSVPVKSGRWNLIQNKFQRSFFAFALKCTGKSGRWNLFQNKFQRSFFTFTQISKNDGRTFYKIRTILFVFMSECFCVYFVNCSFIVLASDVLDCCNKQSSIYLLSKVNFTKSIQMKKTQNTRYMNALSNKWINNQKNGIENKLEVKRIENKFQICILFEFIFCF